MALDDQTRIAPRTRLLVACSVGILIALFASMKIMLPTLGGLAQFPQFAPLMRAALLVKVLSPLLSFFLAAAWVWVFLVTGEWVISSWGVKAESHQQASKERSHPMQQSHPPLEWSPSPLVSSRQKGSNELLRQTVAPSLFQLDPTNPWQRSQLPMTPLPLTNPEWSVVGAPKKNGRKEEEEVRAEERASMIDTEQILPVQGIESLSQEPEESDQEKILSPERTRESISLHKAGEPTETIKPVTLTLLKQMRVWIRADDGTTREVKLRGGENAIRLLLLAHIAWRKGEPVDRDKMLTYVLARGKRRNMTTEQLGEVFDSAKRYLRQDLDRAVTELAKDGHPISQEVDFFASEPGFYRLHPSCRVSDLEALEEQYATIQIARKEGLLDEKVDGSIPDWVREACQKLLDAYPGDFLQFLLERFTDEFGSWVREPFTVYRDYYLDALLIMANYESALGKNGFDESLTVEHNEEQRRRHSARAAQLFYDYAMYAIKSTWDRKLKFAYRAGKDGERVIRAARAMRRCVVELGKLGQPDMIDQVYLAFKERMTILSEGNWKPDKDTESDVADAKKTTSAYRFSSQIATPQQILMKK